PVAEVFSADGRELYVLNRGADSISIVDLEKRSVVTTLAAGSVPSGIAASRDHKTLYVTAAGSGQIYVLAPESRQLISKIKLDRQQQPRPSGIVLVDAE